MHLYQVTVMLNRSMLKSSMLSSQPILRSASLLFSLLDVMPRLTPLWFVVVDDSSPRQPPSVEDEHVPRHVDQVT